VSASGAASTGATSITSPPALGIRRTAPVVSPGGGGSMSGAGGGPGADCTWGTPYAAQDCSAPRRLPRRQLQGQASAAAEKQPDPICGCDHVT